MKTQRVLISAYLKDRKFDLIRDLSLQCLQCKYFNEDLLNCKAFPEFIPEKIMSGKIDHSKPYKGDKGIRFEEY